MTTLRALALILLIAVLGGCLGDPPLNAGADALPLAGSEHLVAAVPNGWHGVHIVTSLQVAAEEYVPAGETRMNFTQMMTVAQMPRTEYDTLASVAETLTHIMTKGCGVTPVFGAPERFTDNGYPATLQTLRCGRTPAGYAHIMVVKTMKGSDAYYQVQRAWRQPAITDSAQLAVPAADMKDALALLGGVHLCNAAISEFACGTK